MKRWLIIAGFIAVAVVALFAATPLLVSTNIARDRIAGVLSQWLGATVVVGGEPRLMLVPKLRVVLPDVRVENNTLGFNARIDSVNADLDFIALLAGRIEPTRFVLRRPVVVAPATAFERAALRARGNPRDRDEMPRMLTIEGGIFTLEQADGHRQRFNAIAATLSWPGATGAAALSSTFKWRGEEAEIRATLSDTASLMNEGQTNFNLALASSALRINFGGTLSGSSNMQADGALSVAAPSLRRALGWIGPDIGDGATLGAFMLEGTARVDTRGLVLSKALIELDGNATEGAIALTWNGEVPSIKGTLASEKIDLTSYVSELTLAGQVHDPSDVTLSARALSSADVDLQVSADQIQIGETQIGRTALSLLVQDGTMALELGEAVMYGGTLTARVSASSTKDPVQSNDGGLSMHLETRARGLTLNALPLAHWTVHPTGGTVDLSLNAGGSGKTLADFLAAINGEFRMEASDPVLAGFDLTNVIETFAGGDPSKNTGVTTFQASVAAGTIDNGTLNFSKLTADGRSSSVNATGHASLIDFTVALSGEARRPGEGSGHITTLPFLLRGPLLAPQFLPDLNKLIETARPSLAN